jgi:hypothetical protein
MRKWLALFLFYFLSAPPACATTWFAAPPYSIVNSPTVDTNATVEVNGNFAQVVSDGNAGASNLLSQVFAVGPVGLPIGAVVYMNAQTCPPGYQVADGSNSTADARGLFIRGLDAANALDAGPPTPRTLASYENTMIQDHTHAQTYPTVLATLAAGGGGVGGGTLGVITSYSQETQATAGVASVVSPGVVDSYESRPSSIVYMACERTQ